MKNRELLWLHLAVILFGLAGVIGKYVSVPAVLVTLGRVLSSFIFLVMISLIKKERVKLHNRRDYLLICIAGIVMALHWYTFIEAIQVSTVAIGTISFSTFPLFVAFLEPVIYKEKLKFSNVIMAIIIFIGVFITIPEFSLDNRMTLGILIGLLGSLSYAVLCLLNRHLSAHYSGRLICLYEQGVASVVLLPSVFFVQTNITAIDFIAIIFLGIVCTAIAHSIYVSSLKKVEVQTAGIVSGMESVYSIIFAFILLQEIPSVRELVGGLIIIGVVLYLSFSKSNNF